MKTNTTSTQLKQNDSEKRKQIIGEVISVAMKQTIIIKVVHMKRHPIYKKAINRTNHFAVDSNGHTLTIGDTVRAEETRPISKTKHYKVVEKII